MPHLDSREPFTPNNNPLHKADAAVIMIDMYVVAARTYKLGRYKIWSTPHGYVLLEATTIIKILDGCRLLNKVSSYTQRPHSASGRRHHQHSTLSELYVPHLSPRSLIPLTFPLTTPSNTPPPPPLFLLLRPITPHRFFHHSSTHRRTILLL